MGVSLGWCSALMKVAVGVMPVFANPHEAAGFVQSMGPAADFVAGDEFHDGAGWVEVFVASDVKPQPFCLRFGRQIQFRRTEIGVPGGKQVGFPAQDESRIAGAHQRFGCRGGQVRVEVATAAKGIVLC